MRRKFNTEEFSRLFSQASDNAKQLVVDQRKKLVLMIGQTGSGKSTATNIFTRKPMKYVPGRVGTENLEVDRDKYRETMGPISGIGHTKESMTTHPSIYFGEASDYAYCDCAGFADTRGDECDVATALSTLLTITHARSFAAVLVHIDYYSFLAQRGQVVKELSSILKQFFVDTSQLNVSLGVCISRAPDGLMAAEVAEALSEETGILSSISAEQVILVNYKQLQVETVEKFLSTREPVLSSNFRLVLPAQTSSKLMLWADSECRQADALLAQRSKCEASLHAVTAERQALQVAERAAIELRHLKGHIVEATAQAEDLAQHRNHFGIQIEAIDKQLSELREEAFVPVGHFAKEMTMPNGFDGIYRREVFISGIIDKVVPKLPDGGKLYHEKFTEKGYSAVFEMRAAAGQTYQIIVRGMGNRRLQPEVLEQQAALVAEKQAINKALLQSNVELRAVERHLGRLVGKQEELSDTIQPHIGGVVGRSIEDAVFARCNELSRAEALHTDSLEKTQASLAQQKGSLETLNLLSGYNPEILGGERREAVLALLEQFSGAGAAGMPVFGASSAVGVSVSGHSMFGRGAYASPRCSSEGEEKSHRGGARLSCAGGKL